MEKSLMSEEQAQKAEAEIADVFGQELAEALSPLLRDPRCKGFDGLDADIKTEGE